MIPESYDLKFNFAEAKSLESDMRPAEFEYLLKLLIKNCPQLFDFKQIKIRDKMCNLPAVYRIIPLCKYRMVAYDFTETGDRVEEDVKDWELLAKPKNSVIHTIYLKEKSQVELQFDKMIIDYGTKTSVEECRGENGWFEDKIIEGS